VGLRRRSWRGHWKFEDLGGIREGFINGDSLTKALDVQLVEAGGVSAGRAQFEVSKSFALSLPACMAQTLSHEHFREEGISFKRDLAYNMTVEAMTTYSKATFGGEISLLPNRIRLCFSSGQPHREGDSHNILSE
jgi:hypothetical protein